MEKLTYEKALEINENLDKIISKTLWEFTEKSDDFTSKYFKNMWRRNIRRNLKKHFDKQGPVSDLKGFGENKAVVGIGAGPSINKNIDVLKALSLEDGTKPLYEQDFVLIATNHQFKPCLKKGIVPHFVIISDAGKQLINQLCTDIPENGQHTILLASLHCNRHIINEWANQGRRIKFFLGNSDDLKELFEKETKEPIETVGVVQGGNVMNSMWTLSSTHLRSSIFMALGNDLSFPRGNTLSEQRKTYYADGQYAENIASKRDEAKNRCDWMGFSFYENVLSPNGQPLIKLSLVRTTSQFMVYKNWLESVVGMNAARNQSFKYYNCSEGGILGVKCKVESGEGMFEKDNWYLLDEVLPKRWCTRRLKDAIVEFKQAKDILRRSYGFEKIIVQN